MVNNLYNILKKNKKIILFCVMLIILILIITFRIYRIQVVFSHVSYLLIVLAGFLWGKRSIWISVYLAFFLILSAILTKLNQELIMHDLLRGIMYIIIACLVGFLREENLKNEKFCTDIIDAISVPLFVINDKHIVTQFNSASEALTNLSKKEVLCTDKYWLPFYSEKTPMPVDFIIEGRKKEEINSYYNDGFNKVIVSDADFQGELFFPNLGGGKWLYVNVIPLIDYKGKTIGAVQSMHDITERKMIERFIKESEKRYRQFFEFMPEGIICFSQEKILHVNFTLVKILRGKSKNDILEKTMHELFKDDFFINHNISNLIKNKKIECKMLRLDKCIIDVEVSSVSLNFGESKIYMMVIRDITEQKKELTRASRIQMERLIRPFTHPEKAVVKTIYRPLSSVSGDFFFFHHTAENIATGIIGDVSGKGLHAALSCLALKMLFLDAVEDTNNPKDILKHMNRRLEKDLEDEHVAALGFRLDFAKKVMRVASAGINKFYYAKKNNSFNEIIIKGPFLGMIGSKFFEEKDIEIQAGDRIYFYTDGLEDIFIDFNCLKDCQKLEGLEEQKNHIEKMMNKKYIYDDCTWIGIEIK